MTYRPEQFGLTQQEVAQFEEQERQMEAMRAEMRDLAKQKAKAERLEKAISLIRRNP